MSRLGKRVERLEGGHDADAFDIVALIPECWDEERASAEVEALAKAHGHEGPYGLVVMVRRYDEAMGAKLVCVRGKYLNR